MNVVLAILRAAAPYARVVVEKALAVSGVLSLVAAVPEVPKDQALATGKNTFAAVFPTLLCVGLSASLIAAVAQPRRS